MANYDDLKRKYINLFLDAALPMCQEIIRGYVPIDTRALQNALYAYKSGEIGIIKVQNITLDYSEKARELEGKVPFIVQENLNSIALARILEVGMGTFWTGHEYYKKPLTRTQDADFTGGVNTHILDPTKYWWTNALDECDKAIQPILEEYVRMFIEECITRSLTSHGWKAK